MAQVTGTNGSPLGYWFEHSPAGLGLAQADSCVMIREEQVGGSQASSWQAAVLAPSRQTVQGQKRQPLGNGPSGSGLGLRIQGEGGEALSKDSHSCPREPLPHTVAKSCCRRNEAQGRLWIMISGRCFQVKHRPLP